VTGKFKTSQREREREREFEALREDKRRRESCQPLP